MPQKKQVNSSAAKAAAPRRAKIDQAASKSGTIINMLRRDGGATLDEMVAATGWQKHSLRGFLAGTLRKRHGLVAVSDKTEHGRSYRIATRL